jgi:hypothetical protein
VDEREDALLKAPRPASTRTGSPPALRLKGTMLVVLRGGHPDPTWTPAASRATIEERAGTGQALGAIVGVAEERLSLPLVF